jgi:RHS repeat-associated protein
VWRWDQFEPFGDSVADENPSGLGVFEQPLRFIGTYADKETGLFYNGRRDLRPSDGRYVESDPIGLAAGLNTYLHVNANPLSYTDPTGLLSCEGTWVLEKELIFGGGLPSFTPCKCFWLCVPCRRQVAWSGNYLDLPSTTGVPHFNPTRPAEKASGLKAGPNTKGGGVSRGGAVGGGNSCLCDFPGQETGCPACYPDGTIGQASRTR